MKLDPENLVSGQTTGRFLVFVYIGYYPSGGLCDVELTTSDLGEVRRFIRDLPDRGQSKHVQVFDCEERRVISVEEMP